MRLREPHDEFAEALIGRLDELIYVLSLLAPASRPRATRIAIGFPVVINTQGAAMNFEIKNTTIVSIPVHTVDAAGDVVPAPSGDVFTVVSGDPGKMTAVIGVMPAGGPMAGAVAIILTPMVKAATGLIISVTDSSGLEKDDQMVDIVGDLTPKTVTLDLVDAVLTPQPIPAI